MAKKGKNLLIKNLLPFLLAILLLSLSVFTYQFIMADKYYPLTYVGDTNISFLNEGQAVKVVETIFQKRLKQNLQFSFPQGVVSFDLASSSADLDYSSLDKAFINTHQNLLTFFQITNITPKISFDLESQIKVISSTVNKDPQNAQLIFNEDSTNSESTPSAKIQIQESIDGIALDSDALENEIKKYLLTGKYNSALPLKTVSPKVTTSHVNRSKEALESIIKQPLRLTFNQNFWTLDIKAILTLLDLTKGEEILDKDQTMIYLKNIAQEIDKEVQEGLFEFNPETKRVAAFKASTDGQKLDLDKTYILLSEALINKTNEITLPVEIVKPKISTSDVNSLGIKELLGKGVSNFAGSIPNRAYNVGLTATKINGVLVPPGEIFSFNKTVGDISAATGYKQAYVIKEGRTVLDDGGGVCQDSTTLFRAALNAGLPIVKRTAHAYRVGYYEQGFPPGLDATVFHPSVDFQFKNDTSAHILIQAYVSGTTLYVDLYGTTDGRTVELTKPIITSQTPPPPEIRQDDPTLPRGTVKQVDWAAAGANVSFKRTVKRNGEILADETWKSNYRPWQAVYLVGTKDN